MEQLNCGSLSNVQDSKDRIRALTALEFHRTTVPRFISHGLHVNIQPRENSPARCAAVPGGFDVLFATLPPTCVNATLPLFLEVVVPLAVACAGGLGSLKLLQDCLDVTFEHA